MKVVKYIIDLIMHHYPSLLTPISLGLTFLPSLTPWMLICGMPPLLVMCMLGTC